MLGLVKQMVKPLASQTPGAGQIPALRVLGYSSSILQTCAACCRRRFVPFGTAQVRR